MNVKLTVLLCSLVATTVVAQPKPKHDVAHLLADSSLLAHPHELPVAASTTATVYRAERGGWQFNLASYVAFARGQFWAIWSAGRVNEDSAEQEIHYSTSKDGVHWTAARTLVADPDGPGLARWIARGVYTQGKHLYALAAYNEGPVSVDGHRREGWHNLKLMRFEWDGKQWASRGLYVENCMNNFPPHLFGGHLFMTCRDSTELMHTALADDAAGTHWKVSMLPESIPLSSMSEPSWYIDPQGTGHILFRDGGRSKYIYQSISKDEGHTWSAPVRTNYPDATSKNFSGRLSNGWYFLINNPDQKSRDPLAISFSRDGWTYSHPMALLKNAPALRFPGKSKGTDSFQYPHAIEHDGALWIIYSANKEDIEITRVPLASFELKK